MGFFTSNITTKGRLLRGVVALLLLAAAVIAGFTTDSWWAALLLLAGGLFTAYEAASGWCVARACGIKTKI